MWSLPLRGDKVTKTFIPALCLNERGEKEKEEQKEKSEREKKRKKEVGNICLNTKLM